MRTAPRLLKFVTIKFCNKVSVKSIFRAFLSIINICMVIKWKRRDRSYFGMYIVEKSGGEIIFIKKHY